MCSGEGEIVAVMLLGKEDIANLLVKYTRQGSDGKPSQPRQLGNSLADNPYLLLILITCLHHCRSPAAP
jgi:hypothetical protein